MFNKSSDPFLAEWQLDRTSRAAKERLGPEPGTDKRRAVEADVTRYLQGPFSNQSPMKLNGWWITQPKRAGEYTRRFESVLRPLADRLERHLKGCLNACVRIDAVRARAKAVDRFLNKAAKRDSGGTLKYRDPINEIQNQIGARIVVFYLDDVERIRESVVHKYFRAIEDRAVVPDSPTEFGYEGRHFILFVPNDVVDEKSEKGDRPRFFELQVKTLFQHAWAEANHDLGYKAKNDLSQNQRRNMAFSAAQAWGADYMFQNLASELRVFEGAR